jgi:hypothetical protein
MGTIYYNTEGVEFPMKFIDPRYSNQFNTSGVGDCIIPYHGLHPWLFKVHSLQEYL